MQTNIPLFTRAGAWSGGYIEALIFFGPSPLEEAVAIANALWSTECLDGPYGERSVEPWEQDHCDYSGFAEEGCAQLVGVLTHPDGAQSPFLHTTIFDDDGLWIYAGTPIGGLPSSWNVGAYPFDDGRSTDWLEPLTGTLRRICEHIHSRCPSGGAIYCWEPEPDQLLEAISGTIPDERWAGVSLWSSDGCRYYPPTHTEPPMQIMVDKNQR